MPKSFLPDNFWTKMVGPTPCIVVMGENEEVLAMHQLRNLSDRLLNGENMTKNDRVIAGAAIAHFLGVRETLIQRPSTKLKTVKEALGI